MAKTYGKNNWALFLLILAGIVIGSFLGYLTKEMKGLSWLNYGMDFGIGDPGKDNIVRLNLGVITISFGLQIRITVASIIGAVASIFVYKRI
ncbi:MAG: putative rane protein [Herbinix sp.]|nr:putative rane protein [Herbinix sp.]